MKSMYWIVSLGALGASGFAVSVLERMAREDAVKKKSAEEEFKDLRKTIDGARDVCWRWTNSNCEETKDLFKFAVIYGIERKQYKNVRPMIVPYPLHLQSETVSENLKEIDVLSLKNNPNKSFENDMKTLEKYRKDVMRFYFRHKGYFDLIGYPAIGEFWDFCRFHWVLYTANNVLAERFPNTKETYTHKLAKEHMDHLALRQGNKRYTNFHVSQIQEEAMSMFLKLHEEIRNSND